MRRLASPIALAALLALAAALALNLMRAGPAPSQAEVAHRIAVDLRCPDCQGLSVADSSSASALEIRRQIAVQLAAGQTADEVRQRFVDRYSEWILLSPTALVARIAPFAAVLVGAVLLFLFLRRRGAPETDERARSPITDADRARAREEAEALDA